MGLPREFESLTPEGYLNGASPLPTPADASPQSFMTAGSPTGAAWDELHHGTLFTQLADGAAASARSFLGGHGLATKGLEEWATPCGLWSTPGAAECPGLGGVWYGSPPDEERFKGSTDIFGGNCEAVDLGKDCNACFYEHEIELFDDTLVTQMTEGKIDFFMKHSEDLDGHPSTLEPIDDLELQLILRYAWVFLEVHLDLAKWAICTNYHAPDNGDPHYTTSEALKALVEKLVCGADSSLLQDPFNAKPIRVGIAAGEQLEQSAIMGTTSVLYQHVLAAFLEHPNWDDYKAAWSTRSRKARLCVAIELAVVLFHELLHLADMWSYDRLADPRPFWAWNIDEPGKHPIPRTNEILDLVSPHDWFCDQIYITTNLFKFALLKSYDLAGAQCCNAAHVELAADQPNATGYWFTPVYRGLVEPCPSAADFLSPRTTTVFS